MDSRAVTTALAVVLAAVTLCSLAGAAYAAEDGGWAETNTNLAIRPAPNDPAEDLINASRPLMFAVMPVTKDVRSVELGDLRTDASCSNPPTKAYLYIDVHHDGEPFGAPDETWVSSTWKPLPTTAGPVKWEIPHRRFEQGVGYAFRVVPWTAQDFPTCITARFTTWAHDRQSVVGGKRGCAETAGGPGDRRLWHVKGDPLGAAAAGAAECNIQDWSPTRQTGWRDDMPTGWLYAQQDSANPGWRRLEVGTSGSFSTPPTTLGCVPTSSRYRWGGQWKWWRYDEVEGRHYWVCTYDDMYLPFAEQAVNTSKRWHYALPWLTGKQPSTRNGGPRDMHLTLETIDYGALIERHRPVVFYGRDENYFMDAADTMTDWIENRLIREDAAGTETIMADRESATAPADLDLDLLGATYSDPGVATIFGLPRKDEDKLDQGGDPKAAADGMRAAGYGDRVYGRVVHGSDGKLWVQYWFWYYFNDLTPLGGTHEGDWEMIQVGLQTNLEPDVVAYATHDWGDRCGFEHAAINGTNSPKVYVAQGSHASYWEAGVHGYDVHWGDRDPSPQPALVHVTGELATFWGWPGRWGDNGPPAPSEQGKWKDPKAFYDNAAQCAFSARKRRGRRIAPAATRRLAVPKILAATRSSSHARVRYSVPGDRRSKERLYVKVVLQPHDASNPSVTEIRRLRPGVHSVRVRLPLGGSPYRVEARVVDRRNRYGRLTARTLR